MPKIVAIELCNYTRPYIRPMYTAVRAVNTAMNTAVYTGRIRTRPCTRCMGRVH